MAEVVKLLLGFLHLGNGLFLCFPLCPHAVALILELSQLSFQSIEPCL